MSETKICQKCGVEKPVSEFSPRKPDGYAPYCRPCKRVYDREHHANRSVESLERKNRLARELRARNYALLREYLQQHPCVDCEEADPIVLEFDHLPEFVKEHNVADMMSNFGWESILREIAKCEVRCANCHRRKTYQRKRDVGYR